MSDKYIDWTHVDFMIEINNLQSQLAIAEKALSFYADPESYIKRYSQGWEPCAPEELERFLKYQHPGTDWVGTVSVGGKRAREALAELLRMRGENKE